MRDRYKDGQENFRDLVICYIIGFQNERYWQPDSEGYKALQDLLMLITERHGKIGEDFSNK